VNLWESWLELPLVVRCLLLFVLGLGVGGQVNRGIYRLAWNRRWISPWSPVPDGQPARGWIDCLPVWGWLSLRREVPQHGSGFWVRPLLIELTCGLVFGGLYWWEVQQLALFPRLPGIRLDRGLLAPVTHGHYLAHVLLFTLMMTATFIDFDEKTIPDEITIPGTILGLFLAGLLPGMALPSAEMVGFYTFELSSVQAFGPPWPAGLLGIAGLLLAYGLFTMWGLALMDKVTTLRRGWWKGAVYLVASVRRRRSWLLLIPLLGFAVPYFTLVWWWGGERWEGLLNSVIGMAFGGLMIWGVRLAGRWGLGIEAMGFGDVTLMAMIGAFVGWQATVLIFFLSPMMALIVAVLQWALTGSHYIAFGPYLCLATMTLIVAWDRLWTQWAQPIFSLGPIIPGVIGICLIMMAGMLWIWRLFRERVLNLHY
jgi:leader peptidase (prepilin peptidase) / N-methyltransferase